MENKPSLGAVETPAIVTIQNKLKAPKNQNNAFGKYKYRSCEDILNAVKPLLFETSSHLIISDKIVLIGDRYYVEATATLTDKKGNETKAVAYAREQLSKKGMDESQLTGSTSSYARKYALNGLFAIDDSKDADDLSPKDNELSQDGVTTPEEEKRAKVLNVMYKDDKLKNRMLGFLNLGSTEELTEANINSIYNTWEKKGKFNE